RVAKAAPDGYIIGGFNDSIMTMLPNIHATMPWDILKDFEPISLVATVEWGLVVNNDSPYRTAADLIAAAKANPGKINYGSGGNGSPQHVAMEMFATTAGISLTHVPYRGATQAALDVASGQVSVAFQGLSTVAPLVRGGKLRLLTVTTRNRLPQFPEVPTMSESALPGFEFNSWFALVAPARTPKPIIARLYEEVQRARADPRQLPRVPDAGAARARHARRAGQEDARTGRQHHQAAQHQRVGAAAGGGDQGAAGQGLQDPGLPWRPEDRRREGDQGTLRQVHRLGGQPGAARRQFRPPRAARG